MRAERPETGILMLTAAGDLEDLVEGLALGADDYLAKPFRFAELVARIRALARRATASRVRRCCATATSSWIRRSRRLTRDGRELELARKEFGVLEALMAAQGATVSAEELLERVWDEHTDPFTNVVRMTIMTLRRKLGDPPVVETVIGVGYRMALIARGPMIALRARTIRFRLTALYAAVFLVSGAALLTIGYLLVRHNLEGHHRFHAALADSACTRCRAPSSGSRRLDERPPDRCRRAPAGQRGAAHAAVAVRDRAGRDDVLSSVIGWLLAGRALAPLREITATARRVSGENLGERIALQGPADELKELADTFDGMLPGSTARSPDSATSSRHASHELRTPLAIMRTEVDVSLADPDATVARPAIDGRGGARHGRPLRAADREPAAAGPLARPRSRVTSPSTWPCSPATASPICTPSA